MSPLCLAEISLLLSKRDERYHVPESLKRNIFLKCFFGKGPHMPSQQVFSTDYHKALGLTNTTYRKYIASMETDVRVAENLADTAKKLQHSQKVHSKYYLKETDPGWRDVYEHDKGNASGRDSDTSHTELEDTESDTDSTTGSDSDRVKKRFKYD